MKNDFNNWLASLPAVPGMIACGVRRPNGKWVGFGDEKKFPEEKSENLLKHFGELHEPLAAAGLADRKSTRLNSSH